MGRIVTVLKLKLSGQHSDAYLFDTTLPFGARGDPVSFIGYCRHFVVYV